MEMTSGCPHPAQEIRKPVRGPHGGWQTGEISALRARIDQAQRDGESLRSVFEEMGERLGRKPNSIRNFYYAQIRAPQGEGERALPFETFTGEEMTSLLRSVLASRARGMSVRACVRELSGGDRTKMLRYQNKYRSLVRTRPELVHRVMEELREEGTPCVSPYPGESREEIRAHARQLKDRAAASGDEKLCALFDALDHLLSLALSREGGAQDAPQTPEEPALRRADRLRAQCDVLRIALDDERIRREKLSGEAQGMITVLKEFIALPAPARQSGCEAFCALASERLSAMECALMQE